VISRLDFGRFWGGCRRAARSFRSGGQRAGIAIPIGGTCSLFVLTLCWPACPTSRPETAPSSSPVRCGANGVTSFGLLQAATDHRLTASLIFFAFDLLYLNGENLMSAPLADRKQRLQQLLEEHVRPIRYCDHQMGLGPLFYQSVCKLGLEGVVSKRLDAPYVPGNRGLWLKTKCLNHEEFIVVGWTDPEGSRPRLGALLLAYYDPDRRLLYAGRAGTGMSEEELDRLWRRLQPLVTRTMPLDVPPPRESRFGSPLELSRVHWVRPELVVEVNYLTWTLDNLLRQAVYVGLREDKPAHDVQRPVPHPKSGA